MSTSRAAVGVRWMIRDFVGLTDPENGESLRNIITNELPDGASCYVNENSSVYRFRRGVSGTPSGEDIVSPIAGGGLWFRVSADAFLAESPAYVAVTQTVSFLTVNDAEWKQPGNSFFALQTGFSGSQWTLGTLGQLTYNGRGGAFLVTAGWSCQGGADVTDNIYQIGISLNADLNGTAQPIAAGLLRQESEQSDFFSLTTVRMVNLSEGDILQPRARCITATAISNLTLEFMSWAVVPVPSV